MSKDIHRVELSGFPPLLKEISDPPKELYIRGDYPNATENKFLCIVGSRKYSDYGKQVVDKIVADLAGFNIVIVSGLALGIDSIAHSSAIKYGLKTIAVPGSGLDSSVLYPRTNVGLAEKILEKGGALVSEFEPDFKATPWSFPQRNRIMAGLSDAVLVIEAETKSGTLITARLASEYNRDVLTVPGSIFDKRSFGPHMLIRTGAVPITTADDVLEVFGIDNTDGATQKLSKIFDDLSLHEKTILSLIETPLSRDEIVYKSEMPVYKINAILSSLEIKGVIEEKLGQIYIK